MGQRRRQRPPTARSMPCMTALRPLGGMMLMFLMQIGEIVFGGVGSGLYGMLAFVILTVFIAGLMVGRRRNIWAKRSKPFDMKMVCLIVLVPPLFTLFGTLAAVLMPQALRWLTNSGAHGFSEILYAFSSMGNNNGSAFGGLYRQYGVHQCGRRRHYADLRVLCRWWLPFILPATWPKKRSWPSAKERCPPATPCLWGC